MQQRLVGQLQDNIHSLDTAKQVFDLETNGLASFALVKGLVNPKTNAFEMGRLKRELLQCHHPLRMTAELREMDNLPTPPPFLPETPPAHLFARVDREAPSPWSSPDTPVPDERGAYPWTVTPEVGGIRELHGAAAAATGAPAGAGVPGLPGVPTGLPLGPLPLPGAPSGREASEREADLLKTQEAVRRQLHRERGQMARAREELEKAAKAKEEQLRKEKEKEKEREERKKKERKEKEERGKDKKREQEREKAKNTSGAAAATAATA